MTQPRTFRAKKRSHSPKTRRASSQSTTPGNTSRSLAPSKRTTSPAERRIASNMREILRDLGEDPSREGLLETPERYVKSMRFLTSGYRDSVQEIVGNAIFNEGSEDIVIVRDIELFSLCEHHMLPFFGKAHVAYIPRGRIIGLSKIPRIVDVFARRLQVQERLTRQIAETLLKTLNAQGVAVIIEAFHFCMMMRGVEKQNSYTITSTMLGAFQDQPMSRKELMDLLGGLGSGGRRGI